MKKLKMKIINKEKEREREREGKMEMNKIHMMIILNRKKENELRT